MSSSMYNLLEAYSAVYNPDVKEDLDLQKDYISEMQIGNLTKSDLVEIAEEVVEIMLSSGISIKESQKIVGSLFTKSDITGRQQKIDRLQEAFSSAFRELTSKASDTAVEEFGKYRNSKKLQESWSARFNQDKRVERVHNRLVAEEIASTKELLILMIEEKDDSYLETDMKKRAKNNEKALADMKTTKAHKDMVGAARKAMGIGEALDPVGEEDDDIDNDGDSDSSDKYLKKRRKAISKAMGKKKKGDDDEKLDEATAMTKRGYDEAPIRQKIAKSTGGGKSADRATALEKKPTFGNDKAAKQRSDYARKQRGDFRKTASSSPGLHGYGHKSDDPKVKAKQAARGAQRGALTPNEKKQLNMGDESFDLFDMIMEFLYVEGYVDTLEEAEWMMANIIDEEAIDIILSEDSRRTSNKQHTARVRSNIKSFGSNYTPPSNFDPDANRGQGEVLTRKQIEKKRRKALRQEEFVNEADSLAAMQARREKRLAAQRKREGTTATGRDFGRDDRLTSAQQKARRDDEFKKGTKKEEFEAWLDEAMTNYEKNRKRAAQRAAARNEARRQGKTGAVPGVGYVTKRPERETWTDESGKTRHAKGL